MWRLKLHNFYGGYDLYVIFAAFISAIICLVMSIESESIFMMLGGFFFGAFAVLFFAYLFQNFMPDVRKRIAEAGSPDWRELKPFEYEEVLDQQVKKSPAMKDFLYAQIPLLVFSIFLMADYGFMSFVILEAFASIICLTHFFSTWLIAEKWENIDGSARVAEIAIDDSYIVTRHYKHSTERVPFYIYYLKEGKFIVTFEQLYTMHSVKIVRWAGTYIYLRGAK